MPINAMEAIKAIIEANITDITKSRMLVTIINENADILTETILLLTSLSNNNLLSLFLTDYEYLPIKKRKLIANSGYDWSPDELRYFMIEFRDTQDFKNICENTNLTNKAKNFLESNKTLTRRTLALGFTHESAQEADTEFKKDMLFVLNVPSNESSVDDMVKTFLSAILSDRFLVKTRYDMQLTMSHRKCKATADVIVMLFPQLYVGLVVIEDKPNETSKNNNQWDNAEAQTIAEAIAVMQQKNWPLNFPVFAIRVLETFVTIYKLQYNFELLTNIEQGAKRNTPYVIDRFLPQTVITGQRPGWDLLTPQSRQIIISAINDISVYIEKEHQNF